MKFAQIFLPAVLLAICKAQPYNTHSDYNGIHLIDMGNNFYKHLEEQQKSEQLIGQYRFLIAKSLLRLKDSCQIYDFLMNIEQKWNDNGNNNNNQNKETIPDDLDINEPEILANQYLDNLLDILKDKMIENGNGGVGAGGSNSENVTTSNILFYIEATNLLRNDRPLEPLIREMLYIQCCQRPATIGFDFKNGPGTPTQQTLSNCPSIVGGGGSFGDIDDENNSYAEKRATPKKVRFHSWGGKRTADNSKSDVPKVMIRTPFRPWGGKRSSYNFNER